ncbi:hypothetical protein [Streptomyces virginiae]|uniref:hypothetical protein n=1 Tax=Streptomyces virginiae TaxID=1961 RepID=UPI0036A0C6E6
MTQEMIEVLTSPGFVEAMQEVRQSPLNQRLAKGSKILTPVALRERGVPLPENMRVSSRYFEEGLPIPINFGDNPDGSPNLVNAINAAEPGFLDRIRESHPELLREIASEGDQPFRGGGCACGGAASVCGGAGWT